MDVVCLGGAEASVDKETMKRRKDTRRRFTGHFGRFPRRSFGDRAPHADNRRTLSEDRLKAPTDRDERSRKEKDKENLPPNPDILI